MVRVYAEDETVLVQWGDRGPLVTLTELGELGERFTEPSPHDELVDLAGDVASGVVDDAREEGYEEGWEDGKEYAYHRALEELRNRIAELKERSRQVLEDELLNALTALL